MRSHGRQNQRRGNRTASAQRGCNTCPKPCPQPCEPEWGCGTNYIEWCDSCDNKFHSLLTSAPNLDELDTTIAELATNLAAIYNPPVAAVTPALVNSLGIFDPLSTLVYSGTSVTIPFPAVAAVTILGDVTLIGNSLAPADLTSIPNYLAAALQAIKLANPGSTLAVTDSYQVLTNELVSFTLVGTITPVAPTTGTYTFTIVALAKIVDCGLSPPVVVSGTVTNASTLV